MNEHNFHADKHLIALEVCHRRLYCRLLAGDAHNSGKLPQTTVVPTAAAAVNASSGGCSSGEPPPGPRTLPDK